MQKYNKYIEYVKNAFKNSFEKAGGNNYRFYHCINTANIAKYIAKELNLSEKDTEIVILAALLHDIGKIEQIQENGFLDHSSVYEALHNLERHENVSARMVYDILKDDFSKENEIERLWYSTVCYRPNTMVRKVSKGSDCKS